MKNVLIADASPLIGLAGIGELSLLQGLFGRVVVPGAVFDEVVLNNPSAPGASEVRAATFIDVEFVDRTAADAIQRTYGLGAGESEALVLAQTKIDPLLLVDDAEARRVAAALNVDRIGTAGILVLAKQAGLITLVRPHLDALVRTRNFLGKAVIDAALRKAGE